MDPESIRSAADRTLLIAPLGLAGHMSSPGGPADGHGEYWIVDLPRETAVRISVGATGEETSTFIWVHWGAWACLAADDDRSTRSWDCSQQTGDERLGTGAETLARLRAVTSVERSLEDGSWLVDVDPDLAAQRCGDLLTSSVGPSRDDLTEITRMRVWMRDGQVEQVLEEGSRRVRLRTRTWRRLVTVHQPPPRVVGATGASSEPSEIAERLAESALMALEDFGGGGALLRPDPKDLLMPEPEFRVR